MIKQTILKVWVYNCVVGMDGSKIPFEISSLQYQVFIRLLSAQLQRITKDE